MRSTTNVKILAGGDFAPCGAYEALVSEIGGGVWKDAGALISDSDFTIFNLETPLCSKGNKIVKSGPAINASPDVLNSLTDVGVDSVSLANNHIFDFGIDGLTQTLKALRDRKVKHVGAGLDRISKEEPLRIVIKGKRISIFSFAEQEFNTSEDGQAGAAILNPLLIARSLLLERNQTDSLIVCVHGGNEYFSYPRPGLRRLCHFLIDIGADAVLGHHPHVPGPYEIYRNKPIFYSLGNLIFDAKSPPPGWDEGYFARLDLRFASEGLAGVGIELFPYRQSVKEGGVTLLEGNERRSFLSKIEKKRRNLELHPENWMDEWNRFVSEKYLQAMIDLSSPIRFPGFRRLMKFKPIREFFLPSSRRLQRLNILRCDSHHELAIASLKFSQLQNK